MSSSQIRCPIPGLREVDVHPARFPRKKSIDEWERRKFNDLNQGATVTERALNDMIAVNHDAFVQHQHGANKAHAAAGTKHLCRSWQRMAGGYARVTSLASGHGALPETAQDHDDEISKVWSSQHAEP